MRLCLDVVLHAIAQSSPIYKCQRSFYSHDPAKIPISPLLSCKMVEILRNASHIQTCATKTPLRSEISRFHVIDHCDCQAEFVSFQGTVKTCGASSNDNEIVFEYLILFIDFLGIFEAGLCLESSWHVRFKIRSRILLERLLEVCLLNSKLLSLACTLVGKQRTAGQYGSSEHTDAI